MTASPIGRTSETRNGWSLINSNHQTFFACFLLTETMAPSTTRKSAPVEAKPPPVAASPRKKGGKRPSMKEKKGNQMKAGAKTPSLTCYSFGDNFSFEAYLFCKDDNNDSFTNGYKRFVDGVVQCDDLTEANFVAYKHRRKPNTNNDILLDSNNYWRKIFLRYVPGGRSTPGSRSEGLLVLKTFLLDRRYSEYPPSDILTMDCTNEEDPHPLDMFFLDQDIIDMLKVDVDEEDLTSQFYSTYPDFARKIWSGAYYPDYARTQLGFPAL
jgi:hypothetical protein